VATARAPKNAHSQIAEVADAETQIVDAMGETPAKRDTTIQQKIKNNPNETEIASPKKRGRPFGSKNRKPAETASENQGAQTAPKKRGRPPKSAVKTAEKATSKSAAQSATRAARTPAVPATLEAFRPEVQVKKKRGRPPKK
jgi:hypothetical protein